MASTDTRLAPGTAASALPGVAVVPVATALDEEEALMIAEIALRLDRWRPLVGGLGAYAAGAALAAAGAQVVGGVLLVVGGFMTLLSPVFIIARHVRRGMLMRTIDADRRVVKAAVRFASRRRGTWTERNLRYQKTKQQLAEVILAAYGRRPEPADDAS